MFAGNYRRIHQVKKPKNLRRTIFSETKVSAKFAVDIQSAPAGRILHCEQAFLQMDGPLLQSLGLLL